MHSLGKFRLNVSQTMVGVAAGLLLVGVACGAAATATPQATASPQPAAAAAVSGPTPTVVRAATPVPTAAAVPSLTPAPAPKIDLGKVTIMEGEFGIERFDPVFVPGGAGFANYSRILQGQLIATNER